MPVATAHCSLGTIGNVHIGPRPLPPSPSPAGDGPGQLRPGARGLGPSFQAARHRDRPFPREGQAPSRGTPVLSPPPHRGGGSGGCSGGGRGARAAGGRGEPGLVSPPRTAARHPAIGAGGRTAARRLGLRMMTLSKPPARPPRRTAAASPPAHRRPTPGDRCRRPDGGPQSADDEVVEAASEPPAQHRRGWCRHLRASGGGGEGWGAGAAGSASGVRARRACRHVDRGGFRGVGGGLDAPSKPLGRDLLPHHSSVRIRLGPPGGAFHGDSSFLNNIRKAHLPCMQALQQFGAPVLLPVAPVEMLVKACTLPEVNGLLPAILHTSPRAACHKIV